jgi:ubiquinone/menaquinone biosynthesis C-methylase UbiE
MEPATEAMLAMAGADAGMRVLDLASGAGSQTLRAAQRVGAQGHVVASDIADTMLHHMQENARAAGLTNVTTLSGAAEDLDVAAESFDAVICRLGLMLFSDPAKALRAVRRALRPRGRVAVVVFTTRPQLSCNVERGSACESGCSLALTALGRNPCYAIPVTIPLYLSARVRSIRIHR